jgi:hypothetical protein
MFRDVASCALLPASEIQLPLPLIRPGRIGQWRARALTGLAALLIGFIFASHGGSNAASSVAYAATLACPPTITANKLTLAQCDNKSKLVIATVSDDLTAAKSLVVEITSTPEGISVKDLVNTDGVITATVIIGCQVTPGRYLVGLKVTDGEKLTATAQLIINVTAGAAEPPPIGFQPGGSVLIYNLYTSNGASPNRQNTRLNLTNLNRSRRVAVHLFFVDGESCQAADAFICLTPNQTSSFLASELDPGTTGYLVAVAIDEGTGFPISFNFLIGDEYVKLASGHEANLYAEGFAARENGSPARWVDGVAAELRFDGICYRELPRVLAASNVLSRANGNDTLMVINRIGGNLMIKADPVETIFGQLFDDQEKSFNFCATTAACQFRSQLSNNFPRTAPLFDRVIPAGRSGWMKFWSTSEAGILGAVINHNAQAGTAPGAFKQGHNLHKLTLTPSAVLTIPVFAPSC